MELGVVEIKKCPVCGSEERFVDKLSKEEKEKGRIRQEIFHATRIFRDQVHDKVMSDNFPFGSSVPSYEVWLDVCLGYPDKPCGNIYAVRMVVGTATKAPAPAPERSKHQQFPINLKGG